MCGQNGCSSHFRLAVAKGSFGGLWGGEEASLPTAWIQAVPAFVTSGVPDVMGPCTASLTYFTVWVELWVSGVI